MCVEDPRSGLPNAEELGIRDLIKADHEYFVATDNGRTDPKRYTKVFYSNFLQLGQMLNLPSSQFYVVDVFQRDNRNMIGDLHSEMKEQVMQPEEIARRALSSARLSSLQSGVTVEQLIDKAHKSLQRKHYASALRNFSFSIDKLLLEKPIIKMLKKEQIRFAKLYCKRAECNLELFKQRRSEKNVDYILDDYAFVMQIGVFNKEYIDSEIELCANFRQFKTKATQLKDGFTRRQGNHRQQQRQQQHQQRTSSRNKVEEKSSEFTEDSHAVDAYLCSQLGQWEKKLALNASSRGDECPICSYEWEAFVEAK